MVQTQHSSQQPTTDPSQVGAQRQRSIIICVIGKMNEETPPESEFSGFESDIFLGLDELGLRVLS